jgi:hypothetical protein
VYFFQISVEMSRSRSVSFEIVLPSRPTKGLADVMDEVFKKNNSAHDDDDHIDERSHERDVEHEIEQPEGFTVSHLFGTTHPHRLTLAQVVSCRLPTKPMRTLRSNE